MTWLDLGSNKLKKVPTSALQKILLIGYLSLDSNIFSSLEPGSVERINVVNISVSSKQGLQQRFNEDFGGGLLILDPGFFSDFQGKRQTNLHGIVQLISLGWAN